MTAQQVIASSLVALTSAVDTVVVDLANPPASDAVVLAAAAAIDTQTARLVAATGGVNLGAPAQVTGVIAVPGTGQVIVQFPVVPGATSYNVKQGADTGGPYPNVLPTTTASLNVPGVAGIPLFFVVSATNAAGEGPNSAEVSATPA